MGFFGYHTCVLKTSDGTVRCSSRMSPPRMPLPPTTAYSGSVTGGEEWSCALKQSDSQPECWGKKAPDYEVDGANTPQVAFKQINAGYSHVCGVRADDETALCWGGNSNWLRYKGESDPPSGVAFVQVTSGGGFSCGLRKSDRKVECWGRAFSGDHGYPSTIPDVAFKNIDAGFSNVCGVRLSDLKGECFGINQDQEVFNIPDVELMTIKAAGRYGCALKTDGHAVCYGYCGGAGSPCNLANLGPFSAISINNQHTCGIKAADGTVACAGYSGDGQFPILNDEPPYCDA